MGFQGACARVLCVQALGSFHGQTTGDVSPVVAQRLNQRRRVLLHPSMKSNRPVYRAFTRIDADEVTDAKTILKIARVLGPEVIEHLHRQVVDVATRAG